MKFEGTVNMTSRRDLLNLAVRGSALTAAATLMPASSSAAPTAGTRDEGRAAARQRHYRPPFKFGLGGVPLGNEFSVVTDEDASAVLEAAWSAGVRYYDMAPWYGLGLAERRFG